jgi:DNA polymerase III delta subunit
MAMKPHIFLFHGPDTFTSAGKIRHWMDEFRKKHGGSNCFMLDCEEKHTEAALYLKNFFQSHTLFSSTKLLVLKHIFSKQAKELAEALLDRLESLPASYFVVLSDEKADARTTLYKKMQVLEKGGRAAIEHYEIPKGPLLKKWVEQRCLDLSLPLSRDALAYFVRLHETDQRSFAEEVSYDLWFLDNELRKLAAYAQGQPLSQNTMDVLLSRNSVGHIFDLSDALMSRNRPRVHQLAHTLLDQHTSSKSSIFGILALLKSQIRSFLILRELAEQGMTDADIAQRLGWNAKRVWVVKKKVEYHSRQQLLTMYRHLLDKEAGLIYETYTPQTSVDLFFNQLMKTS